jgi:L-threonine 3-dehydrogenase (EC 1.1.1.103)
MSHLRVAGPLIML